MTSKSIKGFKVVTKVENGKKRIVGLEKIPFYSSKRQALKSVRLQKAWMRANAKMKEGA